MGSNGVSRLLAGKNVRLLRGGSQYRVCVDLPPSRFGGGSDFLHPFKVTELEAAAATATAPAVAAGTLEIAAGDVVFQSGSREVRKTVAVTRVLAGSLAAGSYDLFLAVQGCDTEASAVYFFKAYNSELAASGTDALDLPGLRALRIARIVIAVSGTSRSYTITQVRFDHAEISVKLDKMPFAVTFTGTLPSSGALVTGWASFAPLTAAVAAGAVAYTARAQDLSYAGGTLVLSTAGALRMKFLESLSRAGTEAAVVRGSLGGPVLSCDADKTDDYEVDADSGSLSITVQHYFTLGLFTPANDAIAAPPKWEVRNCGTVTLGGYVPDSWYHEEPGSSSSSGDTTIVNGSQIFILKVVSETTCEAWSSYREYTSGVAGSTGKLHILNSNLSDPIGSGDTLVGFLADGVTSFTDDNGGLWSYTPSGDGATVTECWVRNSGNFKLYYINGVWYMGRDWGGALVGNSYYEAVNSGYDGNIYYKSGSWYLWGAAGSRKLTKSLGGGDTSFDEWYLEGTGGALEPQGTATTTGQTFTIGHRGLQCSGTAGTPPTLGSWITSNLGDDDINDKIGLTSGTIQLTTTIENGVYFSDKRSFN